MTVTHNALGWGLGVFGAATLIGALSLISTTSEAQRGHISGLASADAFTAYNSAGDTALWAQRYLSAGDEIAALSTDLKTIHLNASHVSRETQCLAEAVYFEARSETKAGQKAVAEVVMNRVDSRYYPNTVCGVVYQGAARRTGCQFSFTCDGSMKRLPNGKAWTRAQTVAQHMMVGLSAPLTKKATHYHTVHVAPKWSKTLTNVGTIGVHTFYQNKRRKIEAPATRAAAVVAP